MSLSSAPTTLEPATIHDAVAIHALLDAYSDEAILLPRSLDSIIESIQDFFVVRQDEDILACGALLIFTKELGEVRSLAVNPDCKGLGYGRKIVSAIEQRASELGLIKLMALTIEPNFFQRLGYEIVLRDMFPEKVWGVCVHCPHFNNCQETPVLKRLNE